MRNIHTIMVSAVSIGLLVCLGCSSATRSPRDIDPQADRVLKSMGHALRDVDQFSFQAHSTTDEPLETGQLAQFSNQRRISVCRPNKVFIERSGDLGDRSAWYDGQTLTLLDKATNSYASIPVPNTIEKMLDFVIQQYDLTIPLGDLFFRKPYKTLIANVQTGRYIGTNKFGDVDCHHLAFQQEMIDWQIWIDAGEIPLPRKLLITYKNQPGQPHYSATMDDWDLTATLSDEMFAFQPPADAQRVEMDSLVETDKEQYDAD